MTPDFKLIANQQDITAILRERLLSLTLSDEAGLHADTLELQLDDRDYAIAWPTKGAELTVSLGYAPILARMGLYVVDEVEHSMPPATLIIRAKAANMRAAIKAPKTKSWHAVSLNEIVATIAAEQGLVAKVADSLATIRLPHLDQTAESDLHLLTRLANDYGATAKPMGRYLVFVPRGEARTSANDLLPVVSIAQERIIHYHMTQTARSHYVAVTAHWHDTGTAQLQDVTVGSGKPSYVLHHPYASEIEARHAAQAKFTALQRGTATLSLKIIGDANLQAEGKIKLLSVREPIAGEWVVQQVKHQLDSQGFTSIIEAMLPKT